MTTEQFNSLTLNANTLRGLHEGLGFAAMTVVQAAAIPRALTGSDVVARAKTGTGKTVGFLVPALERTLATRPAAGRESGPSIATLILSPTRELALQIAKEATGLLSFHPDQAVASIMGGTNMKGEVTRIAAAQAKCANRRLTFLIATPGRLLDHLQNTPGFRAQLSRMSTLVLDEADRLLDMGFRQDLERIFEYLPAPSSRQTLLFSATMPDSVMDMVRAVMRPKYEYIDAVGDVSDDTHGHVEQRVAVASLEENMQAMLALLLEQHRLQGGSFKAVVFFTTARATGLAFDLMSAMRPALPFPLYEMHSRLSQSARVRTSDAFRAAKTAIMLTSDVTARGMDYPDVSVVLQVGLTDREQYVHRVGRTARAGKDGLGILLLTPFESGIMRRELSDVALVEAAVPTDTGAATRVSEVLRRVPREEGLRKSAEQAFQAWLGFYNSNLRRLRWTKEELVRWANDYALVIGLPEPPALERKTVGKMGLKGVAGLRVL